MDPGCGWGVYRWTLDVAGGYRDGPWMWLGGIGMDPGCGWGYTDGPWMWLGVYGWTLDVAGGIGMDPGCGWGV